MTNDNRLDAISEVQVSRASSVSATSAERQSVISNAPPAQKSDNASVSTTARLTQNATSISDVRMEKVAAVQRALADGTYQVSPVDVADKLIAHMTKSGSKE